MRQQTIDNDYIHRPDNRKLDHLPGDYGKPLIGYTFAMLKDPFSVFADMRARYGDVYRFNTTFQRMLIVSHPDYIKLLTLDPEQIFSPRMGYHGPLKDFFKGGLLMRDFGEHRVHRRIMQTAFKTDSMRRYVEQMNPIIASQASDWSQQNDFRFYPNIKKLLLDIGANVFLGLDMGADETVKLNQSFLDMMAGSLALIRKDWPGLGLVYRKGMNGRRELERFFTDLVPKRRAVDGTDMASYFAKETDDNGELFSDEVVAQHLIFLLLAAHDTTTSVLTMTCSFLAHHTDWQDRVREELASAADKGLAYDDLPTLTHTENLFKEVLRLHPPVPQFARRTVKDTEIGGHHVPADTLLQAPVLYIQRMEEFWTDPHNFDPDRFAEGREEHKKHPFQWAPFGGGAHKCIGLHFANMLFKCVLGEVLTRYRLEFPEGYEYPSPIQHFPFAKPVDDLPLRLVPLR